MATTGGAFTLLERAIDIRLNDAAMGTRRRHIGRINAGLLQFASQRRCYPYRRRYVSLYRWGWGYRLSGRRITRSIAVLSRNKSLKLFI